MDSPGRIYLRVEDGIQTEEHRAIIDRWIADYEKNRRTFVFPEGTARGFGYFFVVVGLLLLILQITLSAVQTVRMPSLLGSGIWMGLLCLGAGVVGLMAAQKRTSASLMDFMVINTIINMFSALVVIIDTIGLEIYSKLCSTDHVKVWVGVCDETTVALQATLIFLHVVLFITSSCCGGFIGRTLDTSFQIRTPPLVIYHREHLRDEVLEAAEHQASNLSHSSEKKDKKIKQRGDVASE